MVSVQKDVSTLALSYILAFGFTTVFIVYIINLPGLLTNQQNLVDEYYKVNFLKMIPFDMFLVLFYILAAQLIIYFMDIQEMLLKTFIVVLTTATISGMFYIGYIQAPLKTSSFFSRWFHSAGLSAVAYDMIYVPLVYIVTVLLLTEHIYAVKVGKDTYKDK